MGQIIDGRTISAEICGSIKNRAELLRQKGIIPCLAVILVGDNPASQVYVNLKGKKAQELGIAVKRYEFDSAFSESALIELVEKLNSDSEVHGILVQLPLPDHIDSQKVISVISPKKDVDGLHEYNAGALLAGRDGFIPCTPKGVAELVRRTGVETEGKRCVVVGRSNLVGKPSALMMLRANATVTLCHSYTKNLGDITKEADILISAVGKANLITADMIKEGAVVIDVGQCRVDGSWRGDVDFENAIHKAAYITPVPGGVGPMTITMLMDNTVEAAEKALEG